MRAKKNKCDLVLISSSLNRIKEISLKETVIKRYETIFPDIKKEFKKFQKTHSGIINVVDFMHGATKELEQYFKQAGLKIVRETPMSQETFCKEVEMIDKEGNKKIVPYQPDPTIETFLELEPTYLEFKNKALDGSTYMAIDGDGDRIRTLVKHKGKIIDLIPNKFATFALWYLDKKYGF